MTYSLLNPLASLKPSFAPLSRGVGAAAAFAPLLTAGCDDTNFAPAAADAGTGIGYDEIAFTKADMFVKDTAWQGNAQDFITYAEDCQDSRDPQNSYVVCYLEPNAATFVSGVKGIPNIAVDVNTQQGATLSTPSMEMFFGRNSGEMDWSALYLYFSTMTLGDCTAGGIGFYLYPDSELPKHRPVFSGIVGELHGGEGVSDCLSANGIPGAPEEPLILNLEMVLGDRYLNFY